MTMLMADSDVPSSNLSRPSVIPNLVETLDESSLPIASIEAHVSQSLALSLADRDSDDPCSSIPPRNSDGSSSSSLHEPQLVISPVNLDRSECSDETQVAPESQILPSNLSGSNNSLQVTSKSQATDDIPNEIWDEYSSDLPVPEIHRPWTPIVSPGCGSDDDNSKMECTQPLLLGFQQKPLVIEELTGVGAGLWNLGNTCFLNSVLQCFTHTVPLIESLCSYNYQDPCNCGNEGFCVIRVLRGHIYAALKPAKYPLSPYYFLNNLNYFSPDFHCGHQEDAHEFLQTFLDKLERCLDRKSYPGYVSSQDDNIVEQIFGGRLVSGLRCCNCNSVSETFEHAVGLSLEIEDVDNLWSALESFTRVEQLEEELTCDSCNEKVFKEKQLLLDKLPVVATFHLKRFKNNGFFMEKIFKHVKIPLELDLQPYMRDSQQNNVSTKYYLYAIVEHLGYSLAYGHYHSYVRSAPKIWHKFDDSEVTRIDEDSVLSQDSYILFYAREGTPWFFRAYEEMQPFLEASLINSSPKSVLNSTNGECLSETSYENVDNSNKPCNSAGVSNKDVKTEENVVSVSIEQTEDVFLSAESSGEDSPISELMDPLQPDVYYNPCTEREPDSYTAIENANAGDDFFPLLMAQNQYLSPKSKEGTFQIQLEQLVKTTKNEEEPCKQPSSISNAADLKETRYASKNLTNRHPPRAREMLLDQAISSVGSPPKKIKTA